MAPISQTLALLSFAVMASGSSEFVTGNASIGTSFTSTGSHVLTATYTGDANNATSVSSGFFETVTAGATSVTIASSANPSTTFQS